MLTKVPDTFEILLYEGNGATEISGDQRFAIVSALLDKGYTVTRVTGTAQQSCAEKSDRYLVLGDFSGQAPQLEAADGSTDIATCDIAGLDDAAVLDLVEEHRIGLRQVTFDHRQAFRRLGHTDDLLLLVGAAHREL